MARQTVLLVYGGESAKRDVSIRSARSVYAAMDGEKYDTLLGYIDLHGKWWLLEQWTDSLDEHGGSQLVAALGSHSFLVLPGNALIRPDVVMPLLAEASEHEAVVGLAHILHLSVVATAPEASALSRHLKGPSPRLSRKDIELDDGGHIPDDRIVIALAGGAKDATASIAASIVDSDSPDDALRSITDDALAARAVEVARGAYGALKGRSYALVTLNRYDERLTLVSVDVYPELSTAGVFLKLWRMSGVRYPEVVDSLIAAARK